MSNEKIVQAKEHINDPINEYKIIIENDIAAFGISPKAQLNKYAVFPKSTDGEIVTYADEMSFGIFADDISELNLKELFTMEELMQIDPEQIESTLEIEE